MSIENQDYFVNLGIGQGGILLIENLVAPEVPEYLALTVPRDFDFLGINLGEKRPEPLP